MDPVTPTPGANTDDKPATPAATVTLEAMDRALKMAQEAFEIEKECGELIQDSYARIVDGVLRYVVFFLLRVRLMKIN